jgi:FkbM family methyltransferase
LADAMKEFLQSTLQKLLREFGLEIRRLGSGKSSGEPHQPDFWRQKPVFHEAIVRLRRHQIPFTTVLDIGASDGHWSVGFADVFPDKFHLLVDANAIHLPKLRIACERHARWKYDLIAVGAKVGTLYFDGSDPLGGHLSEVPYNENYRPCPVQSIDELVSKHQLQPPFLIKLDTHGVEIPILNGAARALQETAILIVESYNFTFGAPAVPFWEFCRFMLERGYRPIDVFDVLYREVDLAFWQFDLIFAKSDLPLFKDWRFFVDKRRNPGE